MRIVIGQSVSSIGCVTEPDLSLQFIYRAEARKSSSKTLMQGWAELSKQGSFPGLNTVRGKISSYGAGDVHLHWERGRRYVLHRNTVN
jgi:hypothetical protein